MKICKNCGYAADDAQLRCPRCGDLFEEDMDSMLREMRNNLNSYKNEVFAAPQQPVAAPATIAKAIIKDIAFNFLLMKLPPFL